MNLFDSDDDTSSISSSSIMQSERPGMDEVQVHKDVLLDQSLDALYEKRYASPLLSHHFLLFSKLVFNVLLLDFGCKTDNMWIPFWM